MPRHFGGRQQEYRYAFDGMSRSVSSTADELCMWTGRPDVGVDLLFDPRSGKFKIAYESDIAKMQPKGRVR